MGKLDWKMVTYIAGLVFAAGGLYATVTQLKENQAAFLKKTEAVIYRERLIHRLELMDQKIRFHHPEYYPGPLAPLKEETP